MNINKVDFIHLGPGRTGTTYLYEYFLSHSEVEMPVKAKEINFFNYNYQKGYDWYHSNFDFRTDKVTGEISNMYFHEIHTIKRILKYNEDIKLLAVIRNPYERLISVFLFQKSVGTLGKNTAFEDFLVNSKDDIKGFYSQKIKLLKNSEANLLTINYDNLFDEGGEIKRINDFLNIEKCFDCLPKGRVNQSKELRFPFLGSIIRISADLMRSFGLNNKLESIKSNNVVRNLLFDERDYNVHKFNFPNDIRAIINKDIDLLRELVSFEVRKWKRNN